MRNDWLVAAGILDAIAALLHLGCIMGGAAWYRFFGAGDYMVRQAERHAIEPTLFALAIAGILAIWSAYAFSGAGVIGRLPLLRTGLIVIAAIYLLRAAALPVMLARLHDRTPAFLWCSSAIVLVCGLVHAAGIVRGWRDLA